MEFLSVTMLLLCVMLDAIDPFIFYNFSVYCIGANIVTSTVIELLYTCNYWCVD